MIRLLLLNLLTALGYGVSGWASLHISIPPDYIAIVFVAAGVGLGAVLAGGNRLLPGVGLGSLLVQWLAHTQSGALVLSWPLLVSPLGAMLMAWATAAAIRRWVGYPSGLDQPRQVVQMVFVIVPLATTINASLSVPALVASGVIPASEALFSWWTWWLADTLGAVLFTPLMLVLFGQPRTAWRTRLLTVALPMALALALVGGTLFQLNTNQQTALTKELNQVGEEYTQRLQRRLNAQTDSIEAIGLLMEMSPRMNQATFESAVSIWLQRYKGTQNYGWSPLVTHDARADYEQRAPGRPILGRDAEGKTGPAPQADFYLPITWVVPIETNRPVLGLDVSVLPATQRTVARTMESLRPKVTEGIRLVQERGEQRAVVAYLAVGRLTDERLDQALYNTGVVSAVFRMDDVVDSVIALSNRPGLALCLVDTEAPPDNQRLYGAPGCERQAAQVEASRWTTSGAVTFGDRQWRLHLSAGPDFWGTGSKNAIWITTATGLVAVALLGTFLLVITGQGRRTSELVQARTLELARTNAALAQLAHFDGLTGLANRSHWTEQAQATLAAARENGKQVAILFMDLDRFKHINDSLGHDQGDQLLITVGGRIQECLRGRDLLARIGGDEFVALLPWVRGTEGAATVARKVAHALSEPVVLGRMQVNVTASLGVALFPIHGQTVDELLRHADTAMYAAKAAGRNQWRFFAPEMHERVSRRLTLEASLRLAIETESPDIYLVYQPQIDALTGQAVGVEALMRWDHPELGPVSPQEFIPVAEESGIIEALGNWVLTTVCRQIAEWQNAPQATGMQGLTVSVNVSAVEFTRPLFIDHLRQALALHRIPGGRLELEITESLLVQSTTEVADRMRQITGMGIGLSLDDFGTGYSSLGYLKRLPLNKLKIDRSFVQGLPDDPEDEAIIRATLSMAHDLGMTVVAEGVENTAQRDFLLQHGCEVFQGWLYAKGMRSDLLTDWVRQRTVNASV